MGNLVKIKIFISRMKPVWTGRKRQLRALMKHKGLTGEKRVSLAMMQRLPCGAWSSIRASITKKTVKRFYEMDIKKINIYAGQPVQQPQENSHRLRTEQNDAETRPATLDRVELSGKYKEVNELTKISMQRDEIRTELVERFRSLIQNDQYSIDPEEIADKMLSEVF